ncbi:MAG: hypothetical protein P8J33_05600 [Pirellulaceae bacterium]|nr:hypothetical protein [Pirellulaceae bacterium]
MNHWSDNSSIAWQELDRLVDGRLEEEAYRELLCQIDADPNGWKQCAMAFLEHQALEKELTAFAEDPSSQILACMGSVSSDPESLVTLAKSDGNSHKGISNKMLGWASMATCIVCGLAIGLTFRSGLQDRLLPADIPPVVERGMNNVLASSGSVDDARQGRVNGAQMKKDFKKTKRSCGSQRNRTTLNNLKSRTHHSDPLSGGDCPVFRFADEN